MKVKNESITAQFLQMTMSGYNLCSKIGSTMMYRNDRTRERQIMGEEREHCTLHLYTNVHREMHKYKGHKSTIVRQVIIMYKHDQPNIANYPLFWCVMCMIWTHCFLVTSMQNAYK